jgi:hypothetical protein
MAGAVKMTKSVRPVVIKIAFNTMLMIEIIIVKALAQNFPLIIRGRSQLIKFPLLRLG